MACVRGASIRRGSQSVRDLSDKEVSPAEKTRERRLFLSPTTKETSRRCRRLEAAAKAKDDSIAKQIAVLDSQRTAIGDAFKDARGKVGHLVYEYEIVPEKDKSEKASRLKELNEAKEATWKVDWPKADGTIEKDRKFTADQLNNTFTT